MIERGAVEDLRAAVPRLIEDARRPAGPAGVEAAIRPWFATFPQPQRSEDDWAAFWGGYVIVCGDMSEAALAGAMATWAKRGDAEFLPKPGRLRDLAKDTSTPKARDATFAWRVLNRCDELMDRQRVVQGMADRGVKSEEQAAQIRNLLAGFNNQSAEIRERQRNVLRYGARHGGSVPDLPSTAGTPPKGHHVTREMMRLMGWEEPPPEADEAVDGHLDAPLDDAAEAPLQFSEPW